MDNTIDEGSEIETGTEIDTGLTFDETDGATTDENVVVTDEVWISTEVDGVRYRARVKMAVPRFHRKERDALGQLHSLIGFAGSPWDLYESFCKLLAVQKSVKPRMRLRAKIMGKVAKPAGKRPRNYLAALGSAIE